MATQSILVEDCSPLVQYSPQDAWRDAEANDTLAASYSGGSYHVTSTQGATATFQFRGTGFEITGGRRPGYGPFSISLDGEQLFNGNPVPASSPVNNTLAAVSGLSNDQHTLVLTNTGGIPVDIDTITFEAKIGSAGVKPDMTTIDDNDTRITYLPQNSWDVSTGPEFQNGTLHFSQTPDVTASLQFTGNAVAYYGTVSPGHADLSITIDGKTITMPSHSSSHVLAIRTQYWADGLADGQHTMSIAKAQSSNTGSAVDVDSFVIFTNGQDTTGGDDASSLPSVSPNPISHTGVIVGASVASVVALILIMVGLFLFIKIRHRRRNSGITKASFSPVTPILPMQGMMESGQARPPTSVPNGESLAFPFPPAASLTPLRKAQLNSKRSSKLSVAPSYYGEPDFMSGDKVSGIRSHTTSGGSDPSIPRIGQSPRTIPEAVATDTSSSPQSRRPSRPRRPPTLIIGSMQ